MAEMPDAPMPDTAMPDAQTPDLTAPVVLQEPERPGVDTWAGPGPDVPVAGATVTTGPVAIGPVAGLHPGWAAVIAPGERVVWQGQPRVQAGLGGLAQVFSGSVPLLVFMAIGLFILINTGIQPPVVFIVLAAMVLIFARRKQKGRAAADQRYLLTSRAAYLARARGNALVEFRAYPITADMPLGLGPRSVSFAVQRMADGRGTTTEQAVGFADIADAAEVHAMIRDIQKGAL